MVKYGLVKTYSKPDQKSTTIDDYSPFLPKPHLEPIELDPFVIDS